MPENDRHTAQDFPKRLYQVMQRVNPAIRDLELYEFCYGLNELKPEGSWLSVELDDTTKIEQMVNSRAFYDSIQVKPRLKSRLVLDSQVKRLTVMLFLGLVASKYSAEWVRQHFYFDIRAFLFFHKTQYFTAEGLAHFGGSPCKSYEQKQKGFQLCQDIGYPEFKAANAEVDQLFIESAQKLVAIQGAPVLLAIAGPTAAGKTEIVDQLRIAFEHAGKKVTAIEMDNFLTDREHREAQGIHSLGKAAIHFELFIQSLHEICQGREIDIPRYDSVYATSSHDLVGNLKPGCEPIQITPADIIFIEGNFPFLYEEAARLIGMKVVYLTDDEVRLKRKWRRDIDYRKKYEPNYLRNRFFKEQFAMAETCYQPQMVRCDILVDTSGAALWVTPEIAELLNVG